MPENASIQPALKLIQEDPSKVLGLSVGKHNPKPGDFIPKADAQAAPQLSFTVASPTTQYIAIGLDLDAPFPSFGPLGPILHWIQPGFKSDATATAVPESSTPGATTLSSTEPFIANYIGPAPPPGSGPHRYAFFLYEQPEGFDVKKWALANGKPVGNMSRIRYDLGKFEKSAGLGKCVAVNYFKSN